MNKPIYPPPSAKLIRNSEKWMDRNNEQITKLTKAKRVLELKELWRDCPGPHPDRFAAASKLEAQVGEKVEARGGPFWGMIFIAFIKIIITLILVLLTGMSTTVDIGGRSVILTGAVPALIFGRFLFSDLEGAAFGFALSRKPLSIRTVDNKIMHTFMCKLWAREAEQKAWETAYTKAEELKWVADLEAAKKAAEKKAADKEAADKEAAGKEAAGKGKAKADPQGSD